MRDKKEFLKLIRELNDCHVREYDQLVGDFDFSRYVVKIGRVQTSADGCAASLLVRVPQIIAGFPDDLFQTPVRRTALEDVLARNLADGFSQLSEYDGEGVARRRLSIAAPGQAILPRTVVEVTDEYVEARLEVRLPRHGDSITSQALEEIFFEELPGAVSENLVFCNADIDELKGCIETMEDADALRRGLGTQGLVAFVGDGSCVERDGWCDLPDEFSEALIADDSVAQELPTPNLGTVRGAGIRSGITLILGDAYSGRRDLVDALADGIYNHVAGDGREFCVATSDTVYVAAEAGRSVQQVDIRCFVPELAAGDAGIFSTACATAFESQAAGVVEMLELGARTLIFDEDDSAAGFLSCDARLAKLGEEGPHTVPLAALARQIVDELGVSLVVAGWSAVTGFLSVADQILLLENGTLRDVTKKAREVGAPGTDAVAADGIGALGDPSRWIIPSSIDPSAGVCDSVIESHGDGLLEFGTSLIDLGAISQIVDESQVFTIGHILYYAKVRYLDESLTMSALLERIDQDLSTEGLTILSRDITGNLARPRRFEVAAALNRLDTLRVRRSSQA